MRGLLQQESLREFLLDDSHRRGVETLAYPSCEYKVLTPVSNGAIKLVHSCRIINSKGGEGIRFVSGDMEPARAYYGSYPNRTPHDN